MNPLVVDTSVIVATAVSNDPDHKACRTLLESQLDTPVTSPMVIAEACHLLDRRIGPEAEAAFLASLADGALLVAGLGTEDWGRIAALAERYSDNRLGGTDASVIAIAERLGATRIATLDHRHFRVVRPRHRPAFDLVP